MSSGLYKHLLKKRQIIEHREIAENLTQTGDWFMTLQPELVPHISYPYEWCFEQLRDAALFTLQVLRTSLEYGMVLKDATPFNVQFSNGRPVLIDTLSFDHYHPQQPWIAYRQFCQFFLFPLYLEYYLRSDVQRILSTYINGIPVDITARLLPVKSKISIGVWLHVYLQNTTMGGEKNNRAATRFNKKKLLNLVSHLESILTRFPHDRPIKTEWSNYYSILGKDYLHQKERIFLAFCRNIEAASALDLGCNDGYFSRLLASAGMNVVAVDTDSRCISRLYNSTRKEGIGNILPLVVDISNPSPAIGFNNQERASFHERIQTDLVVALALIHHLVIGKNISLELVAGWLKQIAPNLIIEFIPKEDEKVKMMLASRPDTFPDYDEHHFENYFSQHFIIQEKAAIPGTLRFLYRMQRKK